jgi:hypothetical protein
MLSKLYYYYYLFKAILHVCHLHKHLACLFEFFKFGLLVFDGADGLHDLLLVLFENTLARTHATPPSCELLQLHLIVLNSREHVAFQHFNL